MLCRFDPRSDVLVDPMCGSGRSRSKRSTPARDAASTRSRSGRSGSRGRCALFPDAAPLVIGCDQTHRLGAPATTRARGVAIRSSGSAPT